MRRGSEDPLKKERKGVQLIIAGTESGLLCVLDKDSGERQCTVKVRGERGGRGYVIL